MALINKIKICLICGKSYSPRKGVSYRQWSKSFWCSRKCHSEFSIGRKLTDEHKKKIGISNLGRIVSEETKYKISMQNKGRKPSVNTLDKLRLSHIGQKAWNKGKKSQLSGDMHWNWKGGISKGYKSGYYSFEYKNWRRACMERDNYSCQECGFKGYLTVHHIKSFAYYPELRYELTNGTTLCELCHSKTDNYKGRAVSINKIKDKVC